ncbi:Imm63 family immunity protein [Moheibacter sediminis]|uniref:Immunity protein 63 n=1 Tax=Moheibacter sediminis TaxID=1434700 RepID=A0A1W1ZJJ7_9FLAO|nr:Imm63 family immunity protein [Moheibacter sediminis]SMC48705.1 Immunity protein 63 [Moheibacter sediminis]
MKENKLELKIKELQNKINAPYNLIPEFNISNDIARPFIDIGEGDIFYYVIKERGLEYERTLYRNEDELLYRVFKDVTFEIATKYELENRNNDKDFRILLFKKQEELMSLLYLDWGIRIKSENDRFLKIL